MKKSLKLVMLICVVLITNLNFISFANDIDDDIDYIWLQEEIQNVDKSKEPNLSSRYIVAFDRTSKSVVFSKNESKRVPMASTTKIMTAIVLVENVEKRNDLAFDTKVEVCKEAASINGSRLGLSLGDKVTINDLLYGLMLCSGNDAAIQIAVTIGGSVEGFADLMNKKAQELGLKDTNFVTPHGLDEPEHYTTAYELAKITDYALDNEKIAKVVKTKTYTVNINGNSKTINNTNELLGYLTGVTGVKTGFTSGAGRCLVTSIERDGFNIITVVLGADTKRIRTKDSINLIEYIYSNYELVNLEEKINEEYDIWSKINQKRIYVSKGKKEDVEIGLTECQTKIYPIKKEDINKIRVEITNINTYFEAPVYENTPVADLQVFVDNKEIMSTKIIIKENIERKSIIEYILYCLEKAV